MNLVVEITNILNAAKETVCADTFILQINPHLLEIDPKTGQPLQNALREWTEARGIHTSLSDTEYAELIANNKLYTVAIRIMNPAPFERALIVAKDEWSLINRLREVVAQIQKK